MVHWCLWILQHNSLFQFTWALVWNINCIHLYSNCYTGTALVSVGQEWALAWGTGGDRVKKVGPAGFLTLSTTKPNSEFDKQPLLAGTSGDRVKKVGPANFLILSTTKPNSEFDKRPLR